jgi:hypothetical protein
MQSTVTSTLDEATADTCWCSILTDRSRVSITDERRKKMRIYTQTSRISDRLLQQSKVEHAANSTQVYWKEAGKNAKPAGLWMDRVAGCWRPCMDGRWSCLLCHLRWTLSQLLIQLIMQDLLSSEYVVESVYNAIYAELWICCWFGLWCHLC